MIRRRQFITLLGGAAAWPVAARAQQRAIPVIGVLNGASPETNASNKAAFLQGLKETGYVENQNVAIEDHFADFRNERLPALAADLVRHRVSVIYTFGGPAALIAAKAATKVIDRLCNRRRPSRAGLVANQSAGRQWRASFRVNAPARNYGIAARRGAGSGCNRVHGRPDHPNTVPETKDMQDAATALGRWRLIVKASTERESTLPSRPWSTAGRRADCRPGFCQPPRSLLALTRRHACQRLWKPRSCRGWRTDELRHERRMRIVWSASMWRISKAKSRPICWSCSPPGSSWPSISRPPALGLTVPLALQASADEVIE